jgi:hypothetical protein
LEHKVAIEKELRAHQEAHKRTELDIKAKQKAMEGFSRLCLLCIITNIKTSIPTNL